MPVVLRRAVALYLLLVGVVVAVQFFAFPFYQDDDPDLIVWRVLDGFMAAGLLFGLIDTFLRKRAFDAAAGEGGSWRPFVEANGLFYGFVALTIAFIPNWFQAQWGNGGDFTIWHLIDTALPILFAVLGLRIWREAGSSG